MYLTRKTYVKNWDYMRPEHLTTITVSRPDGSLDYIDPAKITYIVEQVAYWRKANAIHKWFVDNVQKGIDECQESYVEISDLITLWGLCQEVLKNPMRAEELLPTQSGFFFGDTAYDDWYFENLRETITQIEPLIEGYNPDDNFLPIGSYYYQSSW